MRKLQEKLYLALPMLRDAGATAQGWAINRQRYGTRYGNTLQEIRARESFTPAEMAEYRTQQLRKIIDIAAHHVPYYRDLFAKLGLSASDIREPADLRKLPVLEKDMVRANPLQFVDERLDPKRLVKETTTGTTGTPVQVFMTQDTVQRHYAFFDARCRFKTGLRPGIDPYVTFGVRHVVRRERTKPPFWCYNHAGKQLYMSVYHLAPQFLGHYCDELKKRAYQALVGFPSAISTVAKYVLAEKRRDVHIPLVITSGETLRPEQRAAMEKAFGCRVFDQYGCTEQSIFAAELACGHMHVSPDYGIVEILDAAGNSVAPGQAGQAVCTGFLNDAQIFLRYRMGDVVTWGVNSGDCDCWFPILESLEGRSANAIILADGRKMFRMSAIDSNIPTVKEYQIVQEAVGRFTIYVVPAEGFENSQKEEIVRNFSASVGPADVRVQLVNRLQRGPGGKFATVVSKVSAEGVVAVPEEHLQSRAELLDLSRGLPQREPLLNP
jgi:phenylacetate-CoA ligase